MALIRTKKEDTKEENSEFSNLFEFFILIYQLEIYIIIHFMQLVKIR